MVTILQSPEWLKNLVVPSKYANYGRLSTKTKKFWILIQHLKYKIIVQKPYHFIAPLMGMFRLSNHCGGVVKPVRQNISKSSILIIPFTPLNLYFYNMCVLPSERQQHCFVNVQWIFNQNSVAGIGKKQQEQTVELIWRANVISSLFTHGLKSGIDIGDFKKVLMQEQNLVWRILMKNLKWKVARDCSFKGTVARHGFFSLFILFEMTN
jgi:hypothetical protein